MSFWKAAGAIGAGALVGSYLSARKPRYDFRGKSVLLTGGSRGLGLCLARELRAQGATLTLLARDREELDRAELILREELPNSDAELFVLSCDVRDPIALERAVDQSVLWMGTLDVLIHNAGIIQVGPFEETTTEDFQDAMQTHFWASLHAVRAALPYLREAGDGRIVNISSFGGKVPVPHMLPYTASKFALTGFSEGLATELASEGIRVTTVCPGLMRTGSPAHAQFKGKHREEYTWFALGSGNPLLSQSATAAARKIVEACRRGDRELTLGWTAKVGARAHGTAPGATLAAMELVNRALPGPGGIGKEKREGKDSHSAFAPSWATALSDRAAVANNE